MTTTQTPETTKAFQVGQTVSCRSAGDYNCIWTFEIVKRTAKFVTLRDVHNGDIMRVGVRNYDGEECASPFGSYSLAPVIFAGNAS